MLILAMSLSGSLVFLAIVLCAVLGKRVISPGWVYSMLRLDLLFFCLPFPKYNSGYKYGLLRILGIRQQWDMKDIVTANFIGIEESGRIHISFQTYIVVIWAVWVCGLLLAAVRNLQKYREVKLLKENPRVSQSEYLAVFDRVKKEVGVSRGVTLLLASDAETVCTIGVFRKYVIVPESGLTEEEIYFSLKHELIHVKRADVAWRYLGMFAVLLHWFNPLAYLYFYAMSLYCEQSCDAILVRNIDRAARKRYGNLIINMAQDDGLDKRKYRTYLSGSKKMIKWRLIDMMESRKRNRIERMVSLALGMIILFGGSLSVCAYENPQVIRGAENVFFETLSDEQGTVKFHVGEIQYSEGEILDFTKFVGDDGSRHDLPDVENDNIERAGCIHAYVSGYVGVHHKNSDGSCKTDYYYADRCSKCGRLEMKGYSHTETSTKCTH